MPKLPDFIIKDFSGGRVANKSDLEMARNELKDCLNLDWMTKEELGAGAAVINTAIPNPARRLMIPTLTISLFRGLRQRFII